MWTKRLGVQYTKHQAITQDKSLSPILSYVLPVVVGESHRQIPQILCCQNPFRGRLEHLSIRRGAKMGGFTVQILVLSSPGYSMVWKKFLLVDIDKLSLGGFLLDTTTYY